MEEEPNGTFKRQFTPALRACAVALLLAITAILFSWPSAASSLFVVGAGIALLAHFFPDHTNEHLRWVRDNLKLAAVGALVSVSGFLVLNYTNGLKEEIDLARAEVEAQKAQSDEAIRNRDEKIQNLLSATVNVPVLYSPQNAHSRASVSHIVLQWASQLAHEHYLVEITHFDSGGLARTKVMPATNPNETSSIYPANLLTDIPPGTYFWRVAAGDIQHGQLAPQSSWSGYYRFDVFASARERIRQNRYLTIGVTYNQNSDFMRRNEDGAAYGFDAELMERLSDALGRDTKFSVDGTWRAPDVIEYDSIDNLLRTGVQGGEVDFALSSVTKTRFRENEMGVRFTQGYFDSHLVVLSRGGTEVKTIRNTRMGFIEKTTNAFAATELCHLEHCNPVGFRSFQSVVNALEDGAVTCMLVDEPLSMQMLQEKRVRIVMHDLGRKLPNFRDQIGYPKEQYAIATHDAELQRELTALLARFQKDGTLDRLKAKYHLIEGHT